MLNWNDYRNQILGLVGEIGKLSPDTVKGYAALSGVGAKTGHLDAKTRELIALCGGNHPALRRLYRRSHSRGEEARRQQGGDRRSARRRHHINAGAALVYSTGCDSK